ncbi:hypothetical protein GCM10027290_45220 [Micromonospora sonneratiae]
MDRSGTPGAGRPAAGGADCLDTMMRHRVAFPEREHDPVPDIRPVPATFVVDPAR